MNNPSRKIDAATLQQSEQNDLHTPSSIIPTSFWLGGLKIDVVYDNTMVKTKQVIGEARYAYQQILLDPSVAPMQTVEQSFFHEMVHWIFYVMGEEELRNNEKLVDLFAHFLYQARVTETREQLVRSSDELPASNI
ncbi:MAG: hypothetical protein PHN84_00090 [Desulfuromonadaceae bacterium]|nr:hypothetical protein [Desulfuromonadaceae bacterium]MDD2854986.1 hypothetical protein [Desulfuromonadaceae bacterium]